MLRLSRFMPPERSLQYHQAFILELVPFILEKQTLLVPLV